MHRSVVSVVLLSLFTGGIYTLLFLLSTKEEMNREGDDLPTAWLLLIPLVNIWWLWEWAGGIARYTEGRQPQGTAFWCTALFHPLGVGTTQAAINVTLETKQPRVSLPEARLVND